MTPPPRPTAVDNFFANYQSPILMSTFAAQVCHYQYIRRTTPAVVESPSGIARIASFPRPLRAGLGWAAVFVGLLTQITLAKRTIRNYSDPVIAATKHKKPWALPVQEGL